jgi:hypothetical protein
MFTNSVISGKSILFWSNYDQNTDIKVVATGPYGQSSAMTGEEGQYQITGLGEGTYSLSFIKDGYGTLKMNSIQLFGNDTVYVGSVSLFKKYDFPMPAITKVSVETNPRFGQEPVLILETSITSQTIVPTVPIILYLDSLESVSCNKYTQLLGYINAAFSDRGEGKIDLVVHPMNIFPFRKGTKVYFQAYMANPEELMYGYFDSYLGVSQVSTLMPDRHSNVLSFVMP